MSRIPNWGPEIVVNGVRPEWLTGIVERIDIYTENAGWEPDAWVVSAINPVEEWWWMKDGKPHITKIRFAADYSYYVWAQADQIKVANLQISELKAAIRYVLPHLVELDRAERDRNRGNPTATPNAQICINNLRDTLARVGGEA